MGQPSAGIPRFIPDETAKYWAKVYDDVKIWIYDEACKKPGMEDTCKKVNDYAQTGWGWTKYLGGHVSDIAVSAYRTITLQTWPIGDLPISEAVPFLRVALMVAIVAFCVGRYRTIFPTPVKVFVDPKINLINHYDGFPQGQHRTLRRADLQDPIHVNHYDGSPDDQYRTLRRPDFQDPIHDIRLTGE